MKVQFDYDNKEDLVSNLKIAVNSDDFYEVSIDEECSFKDLPDIIDEFLDEYEYRQWLRN